MSSHEVVGATVNVTAPGEDDNVWNVEQVHSGDYEAEDGNRHEINWGFGPVLLLGSINVDTFDIEINPTISGINLGTMNGSLADSIRVNMNLSTTKGELKVYLRNGNEVWTHVDIAINIGPRFEGDYKVKTL